MQINNFDFILPTKVRYGSGVIAEINDEIQFLNGMNVCIITDKGLVEAGIVQSVIDKLDSKYANGITVFDKVEPNPRDLTVQKAYDLAKENQVDLLIPIGGGSSMDVAKAVAVLMVGGGKVQDYEGLDMVKEDAAPIIAIPTTVGTGSEVTFWSVITDTKRHFKMSIGSTKIAPKVALVDPNLVENLPSSIVASTGMDALTHAIEGYTCLLSEPITDAVGIYSIKMIAENLKDAYEGSKDAKAKMLVASLLAGICFGNSDIAAVHAMAEALGGLYDTPHGIANAILLPHVMEYNYTADTKKFAEIAKAMGEDIADLSEEEAAQRSVVAVKRLAKALQLPSLKDVGVNPDDFEILAKNSSMNVSSDSNIEKIGKDNYLELFKKAYA